MAHNLPIAGGHQAGFGATHRTDSWWVGPAITIGGLLAFIVYVTWAALQGQHYYVEPYLSPLYSPPLFVDLSVPGAAPIAHSWLGAWPNWWPDFLPASPAIFILLFPASFRFTCYYYRKAYYRSFAGSPPGCAIGPFAKGAYNGETKLLIFQNLHRFAMYFAVIFVIILYYDAIIAFSKDGKIGVGVGSLVLLINATLIAAYTFGCHSLRHLIGGRSDCMSCGKNTVKYKAWKFASRLNANHMKWAWASLLWVLFTDIYVRLVSMGVITDFNTW